MEALRSICAHSVEAVSQFSVYAMAFREKVLMRRDTMEDDTLLSLIIRGLPVRLSAARDDDHDRDMDLHTAMAYVQRAESLAVIADGTTGHSAIVSYQRHMDIMTTTSAATIANKPPVWTPLNRQSMFCRRRG